MRRGSVIGPLILIGLGVLFLMWTVWHMPISTIIGTWWPFVLIAWGGLRLLEIIVWAFQSRPLPRSGVSGGEWVLVFFICLIGASVWTVQNHHWMYGGPWRGIVINMGENYDFPMNGVEKPVTGKAPRIVIESFRGDARITGAEDSSTVRVSGNKSIRALAQHDADTANQQTPLEIVQQGDGYVIRTNQDRVDSRTRISDDLEISVPKGASIVARGRTGDFDISDINGSVDINSDNAGVRVQNVAGDVRVQLDKSDVVRCTGVKGKVDLRASHGDEIELTNISGPVTIAGTWTGDLQFRNLEQPLRFEGDNVQFNVEKIPGQVRMSGGDFTASGLTGPVRLDARSRDIQISDFTQALDLTVDRGDVQLRPAAKTGAVPRMDVRVHSGDVDLALLPAAKFDLKASTDHGEVHNEYGGPLTAQESEPGGRISGGAPGAPEIRVTTDRGTLTVRKATGEEAEVTFPDIPSRPEKPPKAPQPPPQVREE
ncbi:MAG TPA: DUF4097 family beta strand repeat-containing protein [Bryobacteraceae bacterium]|nr:DUF4097 family beta strand repeat-containing protein [Bryobacteraceae bacterium]